MSDLCEDCPPIGYPTDKTRCEPCPRSAAPEPHEGTPTPASACPWCGAINDQAWNREGHKPRRGDLALCISCGEWGMFGPKLRLQKPDDEGYEAINRDEGRHFRAAWLAWNAEYGDQEKLK